MNKQIRGQVLKYTINVFRILAAATSFIAYLLKVIMAHL